MNVQKSTKKQASQIFSYSYVSDSKLPELKTFPVKERLSDEGNI
jgi:hypothetical protein